MKKTIAQQLGVKEFPFVVRDKNGNLIYLETSNGYWAKSEYDTNGNQTYYETSNEYWWKREWDTNGNRIYLETSDGTIQDEKPKDSCSGKIVEIDGKQYKLKEI